MMSRQQRSMFTTSVVTLVLAVFLLAGCAPQQIMIGQLYRIYTPQAGACPVLEWQFAADPQRMIGGSLSDERQQLVASLSGMLNVDDSFQITATDVAGNQTASVTGRFTSQVSTISIHGDGAGSACDGQTFALRLGRYFSRQGGGGGGGNG
jgi:hypothetical protein